MHPCNRKRKGIENTNAVPLSMQSTSMYPGKSEERPALECTWTLSLDPFNERNKLELSSRKQSPIRPQHITLEVYCGFIQIKDRKLKQVIEKSGRPDLIQTDWLNGWTVGGYASA